MEVKRRSSLNARWRLKLFMQDVECSKLAREFWVMIKSMSMKTPKERSLERNILRGNR